MIDKTKKKAKIVTKSLNKKYGCIVYLSTFEFTPLGLFEPCSCSEFIVSLYLIYITYPDAYV